MDGVGVFNLSKKVILEYLKASLSYVCLPLVLQLAISKAIQQDLTISHT